MLQEFNKDNLKGYISCTTMWLPSQVSYLAYSLGNSRLLCHEKYVKAVLDEAKLLSILSGIRINLSYIEEKGLLGINRKWHVNTFPQNQSKCAVLFEQILKNNSHLYYGNGHS